MRNNNNIKFIAVIVLLVVINYFFSFWFFRIDLSEDKKYELSSYTKEKLIKLNDYLNVDVFLVGDFPVEIEKLEKNLEEKLEELHVYGGQNLTLNYIDLNEDAELADEYKKQVFDNGNGIKPAYIDILKDDKREIVEIWPGLVLKMGDKTVSIQLLSPSSRDNPYPISQAVTNYFTDHIEQNLVVGLDKLIGAEKYHINFLQGHGELTIYSQREIWYYLQKNFNVDTLNISTIKTAIYNKAVDLGNSDYDSLLNNNIDTILINNNSIPVLNNKRILSGYFRNLYLKEFKKNQTNLSERLDALDETDLLIISKPTSSFSVKEQYVIDQFIMNGGKVIWLIDMMDVNEAALAQNNVLVQNDVIDHELQSFLFKYGVRFNKNMICDNLCSPVLREDKLGIVSKWFFYPQLKNYDDNILMKNVLPVKGRYVCSVDTVGEENLVRTALLQTSKQTKVMRQARIQYQNTNNYDPSLSTDNSANKSLTVGWLLEGVFQSNFKNRRIAKDFINNSSISFKKQSNATKMAFIGDGDLTRNETIDNNNPVPLMFEKTNFNTPYYEMPLYGNADFFLNLVDKMLDRDDFISLRSKMNPPRLLNKEELKNKTKWQLINLVLPALLIIIFGISNIYLRKLKYEA